MRFAACAIAIVFSCLAAAETLVVHEIPIDSSEPYVFASTMYNAEGRYLIVLDGTRILMHGPNDAHAIPLDLPEGASAVDFYDIDGDGRREILVVAGDRVMVHGIPVGESGTAWEALFRYPSLLDRSTLEPFPHVLAMNYEGAIAIALPTTVGVELLDLEGMAIATLPFEMAAGGNVDFHTLDAPTAGIGVSIQAHGGPRRVVESGRDRSGVNIPLRFNLPAIVSEFEVKPLATESPETFDFLLRNDSNRYVVNVVPQRDPVQHSLIRIVDSPGTDGSQREGGASPLSVRRYPGFPVDPVSAVPDLNGDGYNDVLMWNVTRRPLTLAGILTAGRWRGTTMRLTAHVYRPERGIFSGEPNGLLRINPVSANGDLLDTRVLVTDIDRDGSSEIGLSSRADTFSVWDFEPGSGFLERFEIPLTQGAPSDYRFIDGGQDHDPMIVFRSESALEYCRIPRN